MSIGKGVVSKINARATANGGTSYSFALKGQDGWYGLGFTAPQFKEGSSVQFDIVQRGNYFDAKNIVPWDGSGDQPAPPVREVVAKPGFSGGKRPFGGGKSEEEKAYWGNRDAKEKDTQKRIEVQAARNAALEFLKLAVSAEAVKLPAKQADKYDALAALLSEVMDGFLADNDGRITGSKHSNTVATPDVPPAVTSTDESTWD